MLVDGAGALAVSAGGGELLQVRHADGRGGKRVGDDLKGVCCPESMPAAANSASESEPHAYYHRRISVYADVHYLYAIDDDVAIGIAIGHRDGQRLCGVKRTEPGASWRWLIRTVAGASSDSTVTGVLVARLGLAG